MNAVKESDAAEEFEKRRQAHVGGDPDAWDAAWVWVRRSLQLTRPGGVLSMVLPDGRPFIVVRASS
jgi:hypothetical protein